MESGIVSVCRLERDCSRADWVLERCRGPLFTVNRWVPAGFDQYLQICPPAWQVSTDPHDKKYTPTYGLPDSQCFFKPVSWSEVAQSRGHTINEYTKYGDFKPHVPNEHLHPGDFCWPLEETPTGAMIDSVGDAVLSFSGEQQECIVAVWGGFGGPEIRELHQRHAPKIKGMGQQGHFLLSARLGTVIEKWRSLLPDEPVSASNVASLSPQAIWPTTAEWFYAVPFDWHSSFFAGPAALADVLLNDKRIEVYPIALDADYRPESQKHGFVEP